MVSVASHVLVVFRLFAVTSIIVFLFVFLFNSSPENSIPYAQLDLLVKSPKVPNEIQVTRSDESLRLSSNRVEKKIKELCPLVSSKLGK